MAKIPMHTRDEDLLGQTIKDILNDQTLFKPLGTTNLFMAMERLHFPTCLFFNKLTGQWIFTNMDKEYWPRDFKDLFGGSEFAISDYTAEMAAARGIHYYYHLKIKA